MASTDEYLVKAIRDDRALMARRFHELRTVLSSLIDDYDKDENLADQSERVLDGFGDLVEIYTEITMLFVRIGGLEDIPHAG